MYLALYLKTTTMPIFSLNVEQDCDKCYVLRITVRAFSAGSLVVEIGNTVSGVFTSIATVDTLIANGAYEIAIDETCDTFNSVRVTKTGSFIYTVNGLYLAASCAATYCSPCFNVVNSSDCLLELSWTNGRDFADLEYSQLNYVQRVWVKGELNKPSYPLENNVFRNGNGDTTLTYGRRVKTVTLGLNELPEFMHNAISLGLIHDEFYVNGVQYRLGADGYDPTWRRTSQLAPVQVEVIKKQENSRNQLC